MRRVALALIVIGCLAAAAGGFLRFAASGGQTVAEDRWESARIQPNLQINVDPATRITFPAQHAVYFVTDVASRKSLLLGPAILAGSAAPGQNGNCVILAHRDTHFRVLKDVRKNDRIVLDSGGRKFNYRVLALHVVSASDRRYYEPTSVPVLTLVTCYPFTFLGRAPKRYIVRAELFAQPVRAPG